MHVLWVAVLHSGRVVSLLIHYFYFFPVLGVVKILSCLIEHVNVVYIFGLVVYLELVLSSELKIFIKTSPGRSSSWVGGSLALSLDALNDFSGFRIDSPKRVHAKATVLGMLGAKILVYLHLVPGSLGVSVKVWRSDVHLLSCGGMVHVLSLVQSRGHVHVWVMSCHLNMVCLVPCNIS